MMMFLTEFLISFITIIVVYLAWNSTRRPKNYPPGPPLFPFIGGLHYINRRKPCESLRTIQKKYGDIFSLRQGCLDVVYVADFEVAKYLLNNPIFSARPDLYSFDLLKKGKKSGIAFLSGPVWKEQRRFVLRHLRDFGFGKASLEDIIIDNVKDVIEEFESKKGEPFNVSVLLNLAVLNITWHMVAGSKIDRNDPIKFGILKTIDEGIQDLNGFWPDFFPWTKHLPDAITGVAKNRADTEVAFAVYGKEIQNHEKDFDADNLRDLIDVYIKKIREDLKNGVQDSSFNTHQVLGVISDLFAAGSDTTATTLKFAFIYLMLNPGLQKQLQHDIQTLVGKHRMVSLNDRSKLPGVEAFILEVLRCSSIVPLGLPHAVTETTTLNNYTIPKGTIITVLIESIHRNEKYWPNPEKFDPSRFLSEDGNVLYKKDGFLPFSLGKRQCLGDSLARAELFLFVAGLLQRFTLSVPVGCSPPDVTKSEGCLLLHPPNYTLVATPYN